MKNKIISTSRIKIIHPPSKKASYTVYPLPNNPKFWLNRGKLHFKKKEYMDALYNFTQAIKLDPENAMIYRYRGNVYLAKKQLKEAILDYWKAIKLNGKDINSRRSLIESIRLYFGSELNQDDKFRGIHLK